MTSHSGYNTVSGNPFICVNMIGVERVRIALHPLSLGDTLPLQRIKSKAEPYQGIRWKEARLKEVSTNGCSISIDSRLLTRDSDCDRELNVLFYFHLESFTPSVLLYFFIWKYLLIRVCLCVCIIGSK